MDMAVKGVGAKVKKKHDARRNGTEVKSITYTLSVDRYLKLL